VDQVVAEVRLVRGFWKTAMVSFADDNMLINRRRSRELVEAFAQERFTWGAACDISIAQDPALLRDLRASGCRIVLIGLESATEEGLRGLDAQGWKERMHRHYAEYVQRIQEAGIGVYGSFILGLDQHDRSVVDHTIRFVNENCLLGAQITILTPFPGSRLRDRLLREKRIVSSDWRWYTAWNEVISHPKFAAGDLERCLMETYQGIYNEESSRKRAGYFREVWARLEGSGDATPG
jgi:radical SAM superfamily enzyme YgiQ (UPF0313 family)